MTEGVYRLGEERVNDGVKSYDLNNREYNLTHSEAFGVSQKS